jgi:hypothetical protein
MSAARKTSRSVRAAMNAGVRQDPDIIAMIAKAAIWIGTLSGFERTTVATRKAVVIDLAARERCLFERFELADGTLGIRLVDYDDARRPLPLATLYAALLRAKFRGSSRYG